MAHLNHIGVAVQDLPKMKRLFGILGLGASRHEKVPSQGVTVHFLTLPGVAPHVELLDPMTEESPVAQFMKKRGPGIHHLSFQVEPGKLKSLTIEIEKEGFRMIYREPQVGAQGMNINFIHPSSSGGILIELMEPAGSSP